MIRTVMKVGVRREADGLTAFTVTPEASPEDLIHALTVFMRDAPTPLVLWDLRQGNFGRFTGDELRWMVRAGYRSQARTELRVAPHSSPTTWTMA
jgi:hypothetical protein